MPEVGLIFVSVLDEKTASHRFRVAKVSRLLQAEGMHVGAIHLHPRDPTGGAIALSWELVKARRRPRMVVFQKTISFALARMARSFGAKILMDWDDGSFERMDGTSYPPDWQDEFCRWTNLMDAAVVSCQEISDWIKPWNQHRYVIPTCLDVENYLKLSHGYSTRCVIGWTGSTMPEHFLRPIAQALRSIARLPETELLIVAKSESGLDGDIGARFIPWRLDLEPAIFSQIDVGIMPLPDNQRARMKAGFKLLQYMAAGIPVVASPIGINRDLVKPGWNGFLAETSADWESHLTTLAKDPALRARLGANGRRFVSERFDLRQAGALWRKVCAEVCVGPSSS